MRAEGEQEGGEERGRYREILLETVEPSLRTEIEEMVEEAASDEGALHGTWDFGATFDRRGRGVALNWDLYGYGRDAHDGGLLAVIQVREWRKTRRRFANVRKSYFLVGRSGTEVFAHPVSPNTLHHAIRNEKGVVEAAQRWMFGAEYAGLQRQGDVALVPARAAGEPIPEWERIIAASHALEADELRETATGTLYALNPRLRHLPGRHPPLDLQGWHRVAIARRARFNEFG